MATTKAKRSVHRAQLHDAHRRKNPNHWLRKVLHFPQTKGKIVEGAEYSSELGYHSISVNFKDKTSLNFAIDSSFTVETDYSDWKTGNQQVLHRWRPVQNVEFRDAVTKRKR